VWRPDTEEQLFSVNFFDETKSHAISFIIYSARHQIYIAISTDFKLLVFNEHLNFIQALPLKIRLINFAYFYEKNKEGKSILITAGIDGCFMFEFKVNCKYDPKQAVFLDPNGRTMSFETGPKIKLEKMPLWIKGLKVDENLGVIYTWSQLKTCFNSLDGLDTCKIASWFPKHEIEGYNSDTNVEEKITQKQGLLVCKYKSMTTYEDYITDILMCPEFKYFITSTFFGHIFVWKASAKRKLIHSFSGHTKTVTSLK